MRREVIPETSLQSSSHPGGRFLSFRGGGSRDEVRDRGVDRNKRRSRILSYDE